MLTAQATIKTISQAPRGDRLIELMVSYRDGAYLTRLPLVLPKHEVDGVLNPGDEVTITITHAE